MKHIDVCVPFKNVSLGRDKYFIFFVDELSIMVHVYLIKTKKNEILFVLIKKFKMMVEKQVER